MAVNTCGRRSGRTRSNRSQFCSRHVGRVALCVDEAGDFEKRCNMYVEIEPIPEEDDMLEVIAHQGGDMETHGECT